MARKPRNILQRMKWERRLALVLFALLAGLAWLVHLTQTPPPAFQPQQHQTAPGTTP